MCNRPLQVIFSRIWGLVWSNKQRGIEECSRPRKKALEAGHEPVTVLPVPGNAGHGGGVPGDLDGETRDLRAELEDRAEAVDHVIGAEHSHAGTEEPEARAGRRARGRRARRGRARSGDGSNRGAGRGARGCGGGGAGGGGRRGRVRLGGVLTQEANDDLEEFAHLLLADARHGAELCASTGGTAV